MTTIGRLLILVACGVTVPPPGWCCALVRWAGMPAKTAAAPCCCCRPAESPADTPAPVPPVRAWCCDRDPARPPPPVDVEQPDLVPGLTVEVVRAIPDRATVPAVDVVVPDDPLLHVLHCVWLC